MIIYYVKEPWKLLRNNPGSARTQLEIAYENITRLKKSIYSHSPELLNSCKEQSSDHNPSSFQPD